MSEPKIRRKYKSVPISLTTATASATVIRWDDVAGGALFMGTVSTNAATLQLWGSTAVDGNWGRIYAADGSAADITLAPSATQPRTYNLPDAAYGVGALRVVSGDTHSTAATAIVMLKS